MIRRILFLAVLFHLIFSAFRIPSKAWEKRLTQIESFREKGAIHYFLEGFSPGTAEAVDWLATHTPERSIILYRGEAKWPIEFANATLYPRLLYSVHAAPAGTQQILGIPVAEGRHPELGTGTFVLVADLDSLRLELR